MGRDLQFAAGKTTLLAFLKALPGELKITANFPEATVEITQFEDVKKPGEGKDRSVEQLCPLALSFLQFRGDVANTGLFPHRWSQMHYPAVDVFTVRSTMLHHLPRHTAGMAHREVVIEEDSNEIVEVTGIEFTNHAELRGGVVLRNPAPLNLVTLPFDPSTASQPLLEPPSRFNFRALTTRDSQ